ncbi:MAG: hypothetical protein HKN22_03790 [Bacteroidia bacterium]|nr:hypothetical protein [Bacteroidia bacterium]
MTNYSKIFSILICALVFISSCTNDKRDAIEPDDMPCDTVAATFSAVIQPLINTNCAKSGCHDGISGQPRFVTYNDLSPFLISNQIQTRVNLPVNDPSFMPNDGPMSKCDLEKLNEWLDSGYPDN